MVIGEQTRIVNYIIYSLGFNQNVSANNPTSTGRPYNIPSNSNNYNKNVTN